jgi:hypothetical protein
MVVEWVGGGARVVVGSGSGSGGGVGWLEVAWVAWWRLGWVVVVAWVGRVVVVVLDPPTLSECSSV